MPPPLVLTLPLPLEGLGMTPFGGLLLFLTLAVGVLTSVYALRTPGGSGHLALFLFFLIVAVLLFMVDNALLFFLLWFVAALLAWGIGQNALGEEREGTSILFLQLSGWVAITATGICFFVLHVSGGNTFSLSAMKPETTTWAGPVLLVSMLLMTSALMGCAWRGGRQPVAAAAGAFLATAGVFVMSVYPFAKLVLGIFGPLLDWRDLSLLVCLAVAVALALAALGEDDTRRIVSYLSFAQLLLVFVALSQPNRQGLASAVLLLVGYTFSCTAVFVALGAAERRGGAQRLSALGGLAAVSPGGAALFATAGLALAGLPPLGAFVGHLMLANSLMRLNALWPALLYAAGFVLIVFGFLRLFGGVYLGPLTASAPSDAGERPRRLAVIAILPLAVAVVLAALAPFWGAGIMDTVAADLLR